MGATNNELLELVSAHGKLLRNVAGRLNRWAEESKSGGWSTHQVGPQQELSAQIHQYLDNIKEKIVTATTQALTPIEKRISQQVNEVIGALPLEVPEADLKRARTQMRIAFMSIGASNLEKCTPASIARCVALSALTGLYPGSPESSPDIWLIQRNVKISKKPDVYEKQMIWQPGKSAFMRLARRARCELDPFLVFKGEDFSMTGGTNPSVSHTINLEDEPSWERMRFGYIVVTNTDTGRCKVARLTKGQIQQRRAKAQTDSFWKEWPLEMALKTLCIYAGRREMFPLNDRSRLAIHSTYGGDQSIQILSGPPPAQLAAAEMDAEVEEYANKDELVLPAKEPETPAAKAKEESLSPSQVQSLERSAVSLRVGWGHIKGRVEELYGNDLQKIVVESADGLEVEIRTMITDRASAAKKARG